jgi:hypothetical protein
METGKSKFETRNSKLAVAHGTRPLAPAALRLTGVLSPRPPERVPQSMLNTEGERQSPKGIHKVAGGNAPGIGPASKPDPERVESELAVCPALGERSCDPFGVGCIHRYRSRSGSGVFPQTPGPNLYASSAPTYDALARHIFPGLSQRGAAKAERSAEPRT